MCVPVDVEGACNNALLTSCVLCLHLYPPLGCSVGVHSAGERDPFLAMFYNLFPSIWLPSQHPPTTADLQVLSVPLFISILLVTVPDTVPVVVLVIAPVEASHGK